MKKIDVSEWKEFRVVGEGGLFDTYLRGRVSTVRNLLDGDTPYIGAVFPDRDNAVARYVQPTSTEMILPGNTIACVCDGAAIGTQTYQPDEFTATTNIKALHSDELSEACMLFLVCALNASCKQRGYSYFDKRNDESFSVEKVKLPATEDGEPDWDYMESYMRSVMDRKAVFAEHLASLTAEAVADGTVVDTSAWKEFKIGDLFDVVLPKGDIQSKFVDDGDVPLVSAGNEDNGVAAYISSDGDGLSETFDAHCATVSMFGKTFWQPESFYAVSHGRINVLIPRNSISDVVGLFISSCLDSVLRGSYDYQTMCTRARLISEIIKLPATPDGNPDWDYMERYMQSVMRTESVFADELDSLLIAE